MMVVLVTGGSGFIGSELVDYLIDKNYQVRVFDKLEPSNKKAEWAKGDLLSKQDLQTATRDVEAVFHLGAIADVNAAVTDPELCLSVNELGTLNLLRACSASEVERFVLASTVWVYGAASGAVTEEIPIPLPNDIYTKTKIGQEHLVFSWCHSQNLAFTILRYDIPYGPRMRNNMAIANFVGRAMQKRPITVYGDGDQGRCWVFISDLARANCMALHENGKNQIFNISGNEFITIRQITESLKQIFGTIQIKEEPTRVGDFRGVHTNNEKARKLLGWAPETSFNDGLSKYVSYVRDSMRH